MIINRIFNFIGFRFINLAFRLDNRHKQPDDETIRYKKDDPYDMKRIEYPLNENSMVVDVGGLTGDYAARIYCRYSCNIDVYEPHPELSKMAKMNFKTNPKVVIYPFGLSNKEGEMILYGDWLNASLYKNDWGGHSIVNIKKASDVFKKYKHIDLLKLNVEGSEYDILPDLINNFDMKKINYINIQFHNTVKDYVEKRDDIQKGLSKTHKLDWNYDFIHESWSRK